MKGIDQLRKKLPDYQGRKIRVFLVMAIIAFVTSLMFQLVLDSIPRIFNFYWFFGSTQVLDGSR
ncbi:MAG: hypothetical protein ACTSO6_14620 [Promethearchaeota archaeon]